MAVTCSACSTANEDFTRRCTNCRAALPRLCPLCGALNDADAGFCSRCGTSVDDASLARARARAERVRGYVPADLRDRARSAGIEVTGEQRQVTVLFVDLVQSTELIRQLGDEAMSDLLDQLMTGIARVVAGFEGTVAEVLGDGALCMFGAPIAHEDDPERALRAALAIRRFVADLPPVQLAGESRRLEVRIGVHTGMVIMRTIGQDYGLAYTAIGDAVHLTQRLETAAEPGEIVVSARTRQLTASLFRFSEPVALSLKGFAEPQEAVRLLGERDAPERRPVAASAAELVGRESDLGVLRACLDKLAAGIGGVLTIWGEAGIGKSRLVAEMRQSASPAVTWLEGRALSYAQNAPYSIIGQQVRRAAGISEEDTERSAWAKLQELVVRECGEDEAPTVAPFIATALGMRLEGPEAAAVQELSSDALQLEVLRALQTLVGASARRTPMVLVFEDLHWSDRASTAAIDALLPLVEDVPILYVLVSRPDTDAPSWVLGHKIETIYAHHHTSVTLGPLTQEASASLAMSLLKTDQLPDELRELVLEKAEGVPLFVEELTTSLVEQGALRQTDGRWRLTVPSRDLKVPDTLQGIILARLDRLEEPVRRVLQVASVIGPVVPFRVLAEVSGTNGQLTQRLRDLQRLEFLREARRRPESEYVFKHALIRDVAYHTLLTRQRKALHHRVGEAMETILGERLSEFQSIIAEHFSRAEAWEKAVDYLLAAGNESTRLHAYAEARLHLARASDALSRLPDTVANRRRRVDVIISQAAVSYIADHPEKNLARLSEGEALARELPEVERPTGEDRLRLARILYWTGRIHHIRGDPPQAIGYYKQVLAVGRELGDEQLTAIPSAMIGQALTVQGQWAKARHLLSQGTLLLERAGEWREWCRVIGYLGVATAACGSYAEGVTAAQRGLVRSRELKDLSLIGSNHVLLCVAHVLNERMEVVLASAREAVKAAERSGEQVILYASLAFRAWAEGRLGNHDAAFATMERSRAVAANLGRLILSDWFAVGAADIALAAGRIEDALQRAEEAVAAAKQIGSVFTEGLAHRIWGQALAASSPPAWDEAEAHMATALRAVSLGDARLPAAHIHLRWGTICRDRGDPGSALDHFQQAAAQFEASQLHQELRRTRQLIAELPDRGATRA